MKIDKWKKKPSKKELYDLIRLQEEKISDLNKEMMKLNVVIRNEKTIRIDRRGLDYMVDLESKYYVSQNIIKEVREYIESYMPNYDFDKTNLIKLLEILDKEVN